MRKAAVALLFLMVAAGLVVWQRTQINVPPASLPAGPTSTGAGVAQYLARVTEEMAFRKTQVDAVDPSWNAAEIVATGTLEAAELDGVGTVQIAGRGQERRLILKDYDVTYASGLSVALSAAPRARRVSDLQGVVQIGELKSAAGVQSFELPESVNLDAIRSVALVSPGDGVVVVSADLVFRR